MDFQDEVSFERGVHRKTVLVLLCGFSCWDATDHMGNVNKSCGRSLSAGWFTMDWGQSVHCLLLCWPDKLHDFYPEMTYYSFWHTKMDPQITHTRISYELEIIQAIKRGEKRPTLLENMVWVSQPSKLCKKRKTIHHDVKGFCLEYPCSQLRLSEKMSS